MKNAILGALVASLLIGSGYFIGTLRSAAAEPRLEAQGRGPVIPPRTRSNEPTASPAPLVFGDGGGGVAAASNGYMAVTGSYGVGTSVLYLFDTNNQQLVVYEARGGSQSMRRLVLVGARRIDLDLQLIDYNDESEFSRADLSRMFAGGAKRPKETGVTVPGDLGKDLGTGAYETTKQKGNSVKKRDGR